MAQWIEHQTLDRENPGLRPSEPQTEYSADNESRSVTRDRTSESATPTSRHYGEGDHIDKTSSDESSTEVSCKQITITIVITIVTPWCCFYVLGIKNTKHLKDFCYHKLSLLKQKRQQASVLSAE